MDTLTFYRKIGKTLHGLGAYRAVVVRSKATPEKMPKISMEIAVDGSIDIKKASEQCRKEFPNAEITLLDLSADANMNLMQEVIEDGIQI